MAQKSSRTDEVELKEVELALGARARVRAGQAIGYAADGGVVRARAPARVIRIRFEPDRNGFVVTMAPSPMRR